MSMLISQSVQGDMMKDLFGVGFNDERRPSIGRAVARAFVFLVSVGDSGSGGGGVTEQ